MDVKNAAGGSVWRVLFEAVAQFDGAVEDGLVRCAVRINGIVTEAFELVHGTRFRR